MPLLHKRGNWSETEAERTCSVFLELCIGLENGKSAQEGFRSSDTESFLRAEAGCPSDKRQMGLAVRRCGTARRQFKPARGTASRLS